FLVDMRGEVRTRLREHPDLRPLDQDLLRLLSAWFDVGFLELRRITWDTSAALLEKLIAYEAVHEIQSWQDLKNRLADDRRCFAFFHPNMPDEPLIFVEVALVNGIAENVQTLLDESAPRGDPATADTAIFYSISNCQPGLAGVSFGNFLIKRVASELSQSLPRLKTFATLSPIPGFSRWLKSRLAEHAASGEEHELFDESEAQWLADLDPQGSADSALQRLIADAPLWAHGAEEASGVEERLGSILMRLCSQYLTSTTEGTRKRALDPVAHFHLSNGARVERINWYGDRSRRGLEQSTGMMVNYLYKLSDIEKNHEAYKDSGRIIYSSAVRKLLRT
ncbi:MAG: malonyl-CoA decarboxylase family protein, partial [Gammaproteobacteria bacterium]|nr:malonyl-CoA decarboxylase family protein [Gammaproteobacteria bacterium]